MTHVGGEVLRSPFRQVGAELIVRPRGAEDVGRAAIAGDRVRPGVGDDRRDLERVDRVAHGEQDVREDDALDEVDVILVGELLHLLDRDRRVRRPSGYWSSTASS